MKRVTIRVPATTANLGPGFDAFGEAVAFITPRQCIHRVDKLVARSDPNHVILLFIPFIRSCKSDSLKILADRRKNKYYARKMEDLIMYT